MDVGQQGAVRDAFFWLGWHAAKEANRAARAAAGAPPAEKPAEKPAVPLCEVAEYCVFDTETSGLTSSDCAIQVAIVFCNGEGAFLGFYSRLWKLPHGKRVSASSTRVHRITNRRLAREGVPALPELRKVAHIFSRMRSRGKRLVAHNAGCGAAREKHAGTRQARGHSPTPLSAFAAAGSTGGCCVRRQKHTGMPNGRWT